MRGLAAGRVHVNGRLEPPGMPVMRIVSSVTDQRFGEHGHEDQQFTAKCVRVTFSGFRATAQLSGQRVFSVAGCRLNRACRTLGWAMRLAMVLAGQTSGGPRDGRRISWQRTKKIISDRTSALTEEINERLTYDDEIDASEISVAVADGRSDAFGHG